MGEQMKKYGVNVKDFGACGDGGRDDSAAIQQALDAGQELVVIPYGTYKIGQTLRVNTNTHLKVHPLARLFLAEGAGVDESSFLLTNSNQEFGDVNIRIEGGIWDGNNPGNPRGPDAPNSYTGVVLNFMNVTGLSLRHLTVRDAESYFIRLGEVEDFEVEHIRFEAPHLRPNQDGVHVGGFCQSGVIRHLTAVGVHTTNDDMVALVADDALNRAQNLGLKCGPIQGIYVGNLKADSCHSFVRLLSVSSPINGVTIEDIRGGCRHCVLNLDAARECRVPLFDPDDPKYQNGVGEITQVTAHRLDVYKTSATDKSPLLDLRTNIHDFTITEFTRNTDLDVNPAVATMTISDIQPRDVLLEGVSDEQLKQLRQASTLNAEDVQQLASVYDEATFRGEFDMALNSVFQLPQGGFGQLYVQEKNA